MTSQTIEYIKQIYFKNIKDGTYIEIGFQTQKVNDNLSYYLENDLNWTGTIFQYNQFKIPKIKQYRKHTNLIYGIINKQQIIQYPQQKTVYGFFKKEWKDYIQGLQYSTIAKDKIDLVIINYQFEQQQIIKSILRSIKKPNYIIFKKNDYSKQTIKLLQKKYKLEQLIHDEYYIFKRIPNILLITRCIRLYNLQIMKRSIQDVFKKTKLDYTWYIIVQGKKVKKEQFDKYFPIIKDSDKIKFQYTIGSGHYLFSGQFLNKALFDQTIECDYSYILDDDNLLHKDFCKCIQSYVYKMNEFLILNMQNYLGDITNLDCNCRGKMDCASMLIRIDVLRGIGGYQLTPSFIKTGWAEDSLTCKCLLENKIPIVYTHKTCAYYNGIDHLFKEKN